MFWTRVVLVDPDANTSIEIKDVEADIIADKALQQIRKSAVRETGSLLFDPEEYKDRQQPLRIASHQLTDKQLLDYAKEATRIMRVISQHAQGEESEAKFEPADEMTDLERLVATRKPLPKKMYRDDFTEKRNPAHPRNKKRSLCELNAATRLEIVKLAAKRTMTQQEVADQFVVKV